MKLTKASLGIFIVAFLVLAITNIFVLTGVNLNRSGEPTSHTILTQRELREPHIYYLNKDNNAIFLRFDYRYDRDNWLNEEGLEKLGFDIEGYRNSKDQKLFMSKEVFIVLENDGDAYQESLKRAEERVIEKELLYNKDLNNEVLKHQMIQLKKELLSEQLSKSRLFAIDAGLSYEKIRQKYDNIRKYIIVKGVIWPIYYPKFDNVPDRFYAFIEKLSIPKLYIPLKHSKWIRELSDKIEKERNVYAYLLDYDYGFSKFNKKPGYQVELKYGKHYEPWVVSVDKIE